MKNFVEFVEGVVAGAAAADAEGVDAGRVSSEGID